MVMTVACVDTLASVAFRAMAGATAQRATPTVPPRSPTHRTSPGSGFGGRLSDNLCVSSFISIIILENSNSSVKEIRLRYYIILITL